MRSVTKQTNKP